MDVLPRLTIEAISNIKKLDRDLSFLLHERDYKKSEILLNVIISGLEDSLFSFSLVTYDLMNIIDSIMNLSNILIDKDVKSYMYFFKSRLFYFKNDYDSALENIDEALKLINESNASLRRKLHVHQAIIWMELGYSKNSIDILQEEYNKCKTNNDIQNKVRIGVELGRSLNHSGQIDDPLVIYEDLLEYEEQITNSYILARIYGEKANILNKKLFKELKLGFIPAAQLSSEELQNIKEWFHEAVDLYELSIGLLAKDNDVFCYSGTVPELINAYLNYSMSIKAVGIDKCEKMIKNLDNLFKSITTPYKTDFNLAKAYYFEYKGNISKAIECIEIARTCSVRLTNKYKEAKCDVFNSEFAYRRILGSSNINEISYWKNQANNCIEKAISYYNEYTKTENNRNLEICMEMKRLLKNF